jgi:hypothetical protein
MRYGRRMTRCLLPLLAAAALAAGCRSPEEKLVDRRRELRAKLDALHAEYARGTPAPEQGGDAGLLGRFAGEVGRAYLEARCLALGRGERPVGLSPRADAFLDEERSARTCREAADLEVEVRALERQVSGEPRGDPRP